MTLESELSYTLRRSEEELDRAHETREPNARRIHTELAELYAQQASRMIDEVTLRVVPLHPVPMAL